MVEKQEESPKKEELSVRTRFREALSTINPVRRDLHRYIKLSREADICERLFESLSVDEDEPGADIKREVISSIKRDLNAFYRNLVIVRIFRGVAPMYYKGFLFGPKSPLRLIAMVPGVTKERIEKTPRRQEDINRDILAEVLLSIRESKKWYRGAMAAALENSARPLLRSPEKKLLGKMQKTRSGAFRQRSLERMKIDPSAIAGRVEHYKKKEVTSATFRGVILGVTSLTVGCLLGVPTVAVSLAGGTIEVGMRTNMRYFMPGTTMRRALERGMRYLDSRTIHFSFTGYSEGSEQYQEEINAGVSFNKIEYDKEEADIENSRRLCIYCLGSLWSVAYYQELSISEPGRIMLREVLGKNTVSFELDESMFSELYSVYVRRIADAQGRLNELEEVLSELISLLNEIRFEKQAIDLKRMEISLSKRQILQKLKEEEFPRIESGERARRGFGEISR